MRAWITLGVFAAAAALAVLSPIASVVIIVFCLAVYVRPEARAPRRIVRRGIRLKTTKPQGD